MFQFSPSTYVIFGIFSKVHLPFSVVIAAGIVLALSILYIFIHQNGPNQSFYLPQVTKCQTFPKVFSKKKKNPLSYVLFVSSEPNDTPWILLIHNTYIYLSI